MASILSNPLWLPLIAALLSGALAFLIRLGLDHWNVKRAEKKLAYTHLVRITNLVALRSISSTIIEGMVGAQLRSLQAPPGEAYDSLHIICALVARTLSHPESLLISDASGFTTLIRALSSLKESLADSKLTTEEVSKLPKEVMICYFDFIEQANQVNGICTLWLHGFENKDMAWAKGEILYSHWAAVKRYFEVAETLRTALLDAGATNAAHANTLLTQRESTLRKQVIEMMAANVKIQAVSNYINQAIGAGVISAADVGTPIFTKSASSA